MQRRMLGPCLVIAAMVDALDGASESLSGQAKKDAELVASDGRSLLEVISGGRHDESTAMLNKAMPW